MGKNNAELVNITPFKKDNCWYLKLVYKYEDKTGKHTVIIPKAGLPFTQSSVPIINKQESYYNQYGLEYPCITCNNTMTLYEATSYTAIERGIATPANYFDIITEYTSREMTLDEIEKELGYKVKIINKEAE